MSKSSKLIFLLLLILFNSCGPRSLADFQEEGQTVCMEIIDELKTVTSIEQLHVHTAKLKRLFERLVDIIIAAHEYKEEVCATESCELLKWQQEVSERLQEELQRIYRLEGARDIIEKSQQQALDRLDAYLKRLEKRRSSLKH